MKAKRFLVACMLLVHAITFSQMNNWVMPPFRINTNALPATITSLYPGSPSTGSYGVANGAYDNNNNMLFFVQDGYVKDPAGATVGALGYIASGMSVYNQIGGEIAIVPIPGECKKYYVIYSIYNQGGTSMLVYVKVDCSGSSPAIVYSNPTMQNDYPYFGNFYLPFTIGVISQDNAGIAVSRMRGSGSSATYFLYAADQTTINYYTISNAGISSGTSLGSLSGVGYFTPELELSPDGRWLAWANGGVVCAIQLNGALTGFLTSTLQKYFVGLNNYTINGLEFVGTGSSTMLYVAGNSAPNAQPVSPIFGRIPVAGGGSPSFIPISLSGMNLNTTFLEYANDGIVYGIYDSGTNLYLAGYNVNNSGLYANVIKTNSKHSNMNALPPLFGVFTLPDQIDGNNYNTFNSTFPLVTLNQAYINSSPFQNLCSGSFIEAYNCAPIYLTATFNNGDPCRYTVDINPIDQYCNPLSIESHFNFGNGTYLPNMPVITSPIDIRNFYYADNYSLYNQPGYYSVTLTVYDCCNNATSQTAYIHVGQAINPSFSLQIYDNAAPNPGNPWLAASTNPASPTNVGSASLAFQMIGGSGTIDSYGVKIEQVNSTGAPTGAGTIYNRTIPTSGIGSIGTQNLNAFCVPQSSWPTPYPTFGMCSNASYSGYTGYFSYTNALYSYPNKYKLTVTLGNQCSSTTNTAYIQVGSIGNKSAPTGIENQSSVQNEISVYPNPATDILNIKAGNGFSNNFTIRMYDVAGRLVKEVNNAEEVNGRQSTLSISTADLKEGVYTYSIHSDTQSKTGMINIIR